MRIFGIDPGSARTGYGCVQSDGNRHRLVCFGSISAPSGSAFPLRLKTVHAGLVALLAEHRPDFIAVEDLFHAKNVRSALKLGHARGVALLAAMDAGVPIAEYAPSEIKQAVVGYGRAEKAQVGRMVQLLLGLDAPPSPHDAADALAVALCHSARVNSAVARLQDRQPRQTARSWRDYRVAQGAERGAGAPRAGAAVSTEARPAPGGVQGTPPKRR